MTTNKLLTCPDLADELGVPLATVYQWIYKGTAPRNIKVGRHRRFRREDVDAWLDAHSTPAP